MIMYGINDHTVYRLPALLRLDVEANILVYHRVSTASVHGRQVNVKNGGAPEMAFGLLGGARLL